MKNSITFLALLFILASCGGAGEKKEYQIPNLGLSITIPGEAKIKVLEASNACEFYITKYRFGIATIEEKKVPTDLTMLEEALKSDEKFKAILDKKTLPNGAFGVVYEKNGKTKVAKDFVFYFKKEANCYRITPIFNGDGKCFDEAIESIASLK